MVRLMERLLRRPHATGLRWALLSLAGLSVAAACSDDASPGGKTPSAGGGEGGENYGAAAGTAGVAGKSTTAGSGGTTAVAGAPSAGEAGMGGQPHVATLGEQCTACGATECVDTLKSCSDSPECSAWLGCVQACDTTGCVKTCDAMHAAAARVYTAVYDCMCTSCKDDCMGAGACAKKTCVEENPLATDNPSTAPATLAETGLYATLDGAGGDGAGAAGGASGVDLAMPIAIASYVRVFEPKYPLWADGAVKDRYVYIPKCSTIDTSDMDHWKFPVGTRFWKTFSIANKAVETRMLHRFGPNVGDWVYAAYQWDVNKPLDPSAAKWTADAAVPNANGTTHDIPGKGQCVQCHTTGLTERVLGFSAFQLSHPTAGIDVTIKKISDLGWLTKPAPDGFAVPGNAVQQAALGYMHGNCGGCHNDSANIPNGGPQILRLSVAQKDYLTSDPYVSTVGVAVISGQAGIAGKDRIKAMDPANSAILIRMEARGTGLQMPPLGTDSTKVADTDGGVKLVTDWVKSIP